MNATTDWNQAILPLLDKYHGKKHPLNAANLYQLLVMVLLSAQDSDANINNISPALFEKFPDMAALSKASTADLEPLLKGVRNFPTKSGWLQNIASTLGTDANIPVTMEGLTALKGIGRKSANVIMRESGQEAEGIIVDLHVLRVVDRLGISHAKTGDKMEKDLMATLSRNYWGDVGMALSFLGRETCRPSNPKHDECVMRTYCEYCRAKTGQQN